MNKKFFGKRLKDLRNAKCLTQAQLAELIGVHEKQISKIESGAHYPTFENFTKILDALDAVMGDFNDETESIYTPLKIRAMKIIKSAKEDELEYYTPILEHLKKCVTNTKQNLLNKI